MCCPYLPPLPVPSPPESCAWHPRQILWVHWSLPVFFIGPALWHKIRTSSWGCLCPGSRGQTFFYILWMKLEPVDELQSVFHVLLRQLVDFEGAISILLQRYSKLWRSTVQEKRWVLIGWPFYSWWSTPPLGGCLLQWLLFFCLHLSFPTGYTAT